MQNLSVQNCLEGNNCIRWDAIGFDTRSLTGTEERNITCFLICLTSIVSVWFPPKKSLRESYLLAINLGVYMIPGRRGEDPTKAPEQTKPKQKCIIGHCYKHLVLSPAGTFWETAWDALETGFPRSQSQVYLSNSLAKLIPSPLWVARLSVVQPLVQGNSRAESRS